LFGYGKTVVSIGNAFDGQTENIPALWDARTIACLRKIAAENYSQSTHSHAHLNPRLPKWTTAATNPHARKNKTLSRRDTPPSRSALHRHSLSF
jgi:hypothetical protein